MDLLDKLAKQKLKQPQGIKNFIWNKTNYQTSPYGTYDCVEVMEKWQGIWLLRVFAYNLKGKRRYKDIQIHEVQRKLLGYKEYLSSLNVWNTAMAGRRIDFTAKSGFGKVKKNWEFYGYEMFNEQDVINDLNIPYCAWNIYKEQKVSWDKKLRFIDYITLYIENPKIELLVKAGCSEHLTGLRYLDFNKKKLHEIYKVDIKWKECIQELSMSDILLIRKNHNFRNLDDLEVYKEIYKCSYNSYKYIKKYTKFLRLVDYLKTQNRTNQYQVLHEYNDYLRFAEELGIDLRRNKNIYPKNLHSEHTKLMNLVEVKRSKELEEKFKKQFNKYKKHFYVDDEYIITPVKHPEELIDESKILRHCVRTYAEDVAKGNSEILFVRYAEEPNKPFITVEVRNKKVTQVRGLNNCSPPERVVSFLKQWSKKKKISYGG